MECPVVRRLIFFFQWLSFFFVAATMEEDTAGGRQRCAEGGHSLEEVTLCPDMELPVAHMGEIEPREWP